MSKVSFIKKASDSKLLEMASYAIALQVDFKLLSEELDKAKVFFRSKADGEKLDIVVAGEGAVLVKTPAFSAAASGESISLNEAAFDALSTVTKKELIRLGVVVYTYWEKKESTALAAVTITPNK